MRILKRENNECLFHPFVSHNLLKMMNARNNYRMCYKSLKSILEEVN